jgi:hypothetical protein
MACVKKDTETNKQTKSVCVTTFTVFLRSLKQIYTYKTHIVPIIGKSEILWCCMTRVCIVTRTGRIITRTS